MANKRYMSLVVANGVSLIITLATVAVIGRPQRRAPTPLDQLDVSREVVGGTFNRWFNISSTIIVPLAEDASFGDYTCRVCSSMPQQCDSATISLHLLGAPPVLRKAVDNVPSTILGNTFTYDIGADICLSFSKIERINIQCPTLSNVSTPFPQPRRTWVKDGVLVSSGFGDEDIEDSFFMRGNNSLFLPMVVLPQPFSLSSTGIGLTLYTAVRNFTLALMAPNGTTIESVRRRVFEQLLGSYSCSVRNVFGSDTAVTTVTECSEPSPTTVTDAMATTTEESRSLYFMLNGQRYPSGSSVLITDVGVTSDISVLDLGSALACVTSEVNTLCCRGRDGGNVGEWFFPDGSMVPRNSDNRNADFTRSGFTHQVRLNHRNNAVGPVGTYTCRVPDGTDSSVIHSATITLESFLPLPRVVRCFEVVCVWQGPAEGSLEDYAGYEIRFGGEVVFQHENDEFFHVVDGDPRIQALGPPQDVTVEVRVQGDGDRQNPWSAPVPLSPEVVA